MRSAYDARAIEMNVRPPPPVRPSGRDGALEYERGDLKDLMSCNSDHCHALPFFKEQNSSASSLQYHLKAVISMPKDK